MEFPRKYPSTASLILTSYFLIHTAHLHRISRVSSFYSQCGQSSSPSRPPYWLSLPTHRPRISDAAEGRSLPALKIRSVCPTTPTAPTPRDALATASSRTSISRAVFGDLTRPIAMILKNALTTRVYLIPAGWPATFLVSASPRIRRRVLDSQASSAPRACIATISLMMAVILRTVVQTALEFACKKDGKILLESVQV